MTVSNPAPGLSVAIVMRRISEHLVALAAQARRVEQVAAHVGQAEGTDGNAVNETAIRDIQQIDHLRQSLDDLAVLTGQLGGVANLGPLGQDQIDAILCTLSLGKSRDLLRDCKSPNEMPHSHGAAGEAQIF